MSADKEPRTYLRTECAVFRKTSEAFGGLSNMAPGYPVRVNGIRIFTVEALYQACRFPHMVDVQRKIIGQHSPMTAKMVSKPYRMDSRPDWDRVRVKVMRWCLRMKLTQHWPKFSQLLLSTGDRSIVEDSRKDGFWGAVPSEGGTLVGMNVLGRLLMELREAIKQGAELRRVEPPAIADFLLFGEPLQVVDFRTAKNAPVDVEEITAKYTYDELTLPLFAEAGATAPSRAVVTATALPTERSQGMIEGLKPYPKYKDSRQAWLGDVPAHWDLKPGHSAFTKRKLSNVGLKENTVLSLSYGRIKVKPADKQHGLVPESYETYQIVDEGNIIIRGTDLQNDHTSLRIGLSRNRGIISSAYLCLEARETITPDYGYQILNTFDLTKAIYRYGSGLRQNLDHGEIKRLPIFLPPLDEQLAIVRFLDHANRKIDGFIRAKRKLIGLLNEQKQAIIHRAVTRGLDPNAKLKPSGIPWLGEIPAHWGRTRLKFEASHIVDCLHATPDYRDDGVYPAIRTADIEPGRVRLERARLIAEKEFQRWTARLKPDVGDILYSREGERFGIAATVPPNTSLCISQRMMVFRIRKRQNSEYLMWQLNCQHVYLQASCYVMGSTAPHVNVQQIKNFLLALPPLDEQNKIVEYIARDCDVINTAIARTEREIALMQEYRTRLTADIVTGKLDVREAAAKLPEPVAEEASDSEISEEETELEEVEG